MKYYKGKIKMHCIKKCKIDSSRPYVVRLPSVLFRIPNTSTTERVGKGPTRSEGVNLRGFQSHFEILLTPTEKEIFL